ncbi:MAG: ribosome maturation factor RimP [Anaerovoracaceae bacterium]
MAKKKIKEIVAEALADFLKEEGYELYNVEFVKEAKDWFLRVYIDKQHSQETDYIGTEDCEKVSRYLSQRMDELDPIEQNYYLEVSSPGMDRELILDRHFEKFTGRPIDISFYKPVNGEKAMTGILLGLREGVLSVQDATGATIELPREEIAKVKLAVVF